MLELKFTLDDERTRNLADLAKLSGRTLEDEAIEILRQEIFKRDLQSKQADDIIGIAPIVRDY